jgi:hypothetical protein
MNINHKLNETKIASIRMVNTIHVGLNNRCAHFAHMYALLVSI